MSSIERLAGQMEQLIGLLHTQPRSAARSTRAWNDGGGVSVPQMAALSILRERGPSTLRALAEAVGVSPPAMSQLVDRMVRHGLVSRREDPVDRRRTQLAATPRSEALLRRISSARRGHFALALRELPPSLSRELAGTLARVLQFFEEQSRWNQRLESSTASSSRSSSRTRGSARTAGARSAKRSTASRTPGSARSTTSASSASD